jgi:hypothetical protein
LRIMHKIATFCIFWINLFAQWVQDSFLSFFFLLISLIEDVYLWTFQKTFLKLQVKEKINAWFKFVLTHWGEQVAKNWCKQSLLICFLMTSKTRGISYIGICVKP